jgi:undecaprenyl-diphosphatase
LAWALAVITAHRLWLTLRERPETVRGEATDTTDTAVA